MAAQLETCGDLSIQLVDPPTHKEREVSHAKTHPSNLTTLTPYICVALSSQLFGLDQTWVFEGDYDVKVTLNNNL